ncbi:MAG: hypothetical protein DLM50_04425 [Candidatus Meridianibacter frigidus]|nr:MAG: hypothetical protein DLM50_04425 [Candidatus Eremiobacteraeota bacterium]
MKLLFSALISAALLLSAVQAALAAEFYGITRHVSTTNIKVYNPKSGQTLGFAILPKFKNVFSEDGKTTYQMAKIHAGQYVKIYYDQHFFGMRHADRIYLLTSRNGKMGHQ